jgi:hypothetical protein
MPHHTSRNATVSPRSLQFIAAFTPVLPSTLTHLSHHLPPEILAKINRIVNIWEERGVFPLEVIKGFREALGPGAVKNGPLASSSPVTASAPRPLSEPPSGPPIPSNMSTLHRYMSKLAQLDEEHGTAQAVGGGFGTLESQIAAIPGVYFEENGLREFRGSWVLSSRCWWD